MGCLFSSSASSPVDPHKEDGASKKADDAVELPEHLVVAARELLQAPVLQIPEAAGVLEQLNAAFEEKGGESADAVKKSRVARFSEPFRGLNGRLRSEIVQCLSRMPSAIDVLHAREGDDGAAGLPSAPVQDASMDDGDKEAGGEEGATEKPPADGPLDGSTEEVPFDLPRFAEGLVSEDLAGKELRGQIAAIALWDMAGAAGLLRTDGPYPVADLESAAEKSADQHVAWAEQRGSETCEGAGVIYGIAVACYLGKPQIVTTLATAYRERRGLPAYWDMKSHAAICCSVDGSRRAAWYKLEGALAGLEGPLQPSDVEETLKGVVDKKSWTKAKLVIEPLFLSEICKALPVPADHEEVLPGLQTWAAAAVETEAEAYNASEEEGVALRRCVTPVAWWDLAGVLSKDAKVKMLQETEPIQVALAGHLRWSAAGGNGAVLRRSLFCADCIMGNADGDLLASSVQAASEAYKSHRGLPAAWDLSAEFRAGGSSREAWGALEQLMRARGEDEDASVLIDAGVVADELRRLQGDGFGTFVAECLKQGLGQVPPDEQSLVAEFTANFSLGADSQRPMPFAAWWLLAAGLHQEGLTGEEWKQCESAAISAGQRVLAWAVEIATDTNEVAPLQYALYGAAAQHSSIVTWAKSTDIAATSYQTIRGLPSWWDVHGEFSGYGTELPGYSGYSERSPDVWQAAMKFVGSGEHGSPLANAAALPDRLEPIILELEGDEAGESASAAKMINLLLEMMLHHTRRLPRSREAFIEQAQALESAFASDTSEDELQEAVEVTRIFCLFDGLMSILHGFQLAEWQEKLAPEMIRSAVTFLETAKSLVEEASEDTDVAPLLRLGLFVAFHLEARELEEYKALANMYREKRGLPAGWDLQGVLAGDAAARGAWASAEALATATEVPDSDAATEQLRTLCTDGYRLAAVGAICQLLAREYDDEKQVIEAYMNEVDDDSCYAGLKGTIRCLLWWDISRELFVDSARELFFGGGSPVMDAAKDAEMEASELSTRKLIAEIFKLLDEDGDGLLNSKEHGHFARLCGYTGGRHAWEKLHIAVMKQMGMSDEAIAENPGLSLQAFDRLVSSSEKFDKDALTRLRSQLFAAAGGPMSPGGRRRSGSSPRPGSIRRSGLGSPKASAPKDDDDIDDEIEEGHGGNVDETKLIVERLGKARMSAAEWHLSWAQTTCSEYDLGKDVDPKVSLLLSIMCRRGLLAAQCLGVGSLPAVKRLGTTYRKVHSLPDWFTVQEAVAASMDPDASVAWAAAERVSRNCEPQDSLKALRVECEERGIEKTAVDLVGATLLSSFLKMPVDMEQECQRFNKALQNGDSGGKLRSTIAAVYSLDDASTQGFTDATREDGQPVLSSSFLSALARRHLLWSQSKVSSANREQGAANCRYALFATHCLCTWAKVPFPTQFGEMARVYCRFEQFDAELSSVSSLLVAYEAGALKDCLELLADPEAIDLADNVEEKLTPLVMLGTRRPDLREGDKLLLPRYEQIEAASLKAGLSKSIELITEKQEADWRRISGQRCQIVDFYDKYASSDVIRVRAPHGGVVTVGRDAACERILDSAVRERICLQLAVALQVPNDESEAENFQALLAGEADSEDLHNACSAVRINDVILRLGHQVRSSKDILAAREQCAQRYLVRGPSAKPGSNATLQLGLFVGQCMGLWTHPGFKIAAAAYRQLHGLPDYWNVEEMAAAYDGDVALRDVWRRAEAALAGTGEGGAPDAEAVQALLAEEPDGGDQEPWRCLKKLIPSAAPAYWDHAGFFGQFDEMVAVAKHDALGRPTDIYAAMQNMLDNVWKPIATRDRPCPKGTCASTAGGCPCVQKGGDPGMPDGIRVRRILRNEDSKRWQQYLDRREQLTRKRSGNVEPRMTSKTMPYLDDTRYFDQLDANMNEMYLLHGTFVRAALSISQTGFSINLAGSSVGTMYGRGAYFTECSSKADEYAKDEGGGYYKGVFAVLVCRVLLGVPFVTEDRDTEARTRFDAGTVDSTLGDREKSVNTYREFVVYDMNQVYPEYCVLYERLGKGYAFDGDAAHWGALRREISKVVMEVPVHWQNVHINPNSEGFNEIYRVSRSVRSCLESMVSYPKTFDGAEYSVFRADRLEDSKLWNRYLAKRKEHQLRGEGGCPKLEDSLDVTGIKSMLSTEQQLHSNILAAVTRPRCTFGEKCYRKNRKHRQEFCHPGDRDWDHPDMPGSPKGTPKARPGLAEADFAQSLLESVDHTINEVFLWQRTTLTPERLLEDGFNISPEAGMLDENRTFYETAAACINQAHIDGAGERCSLLFCRVLCGTAEVIPPTDDFEDRAESLFESGRTDSVVARAPDGEVRMFAVLSSAHVYPEYLVQVCRKDSGGA